MSCYYCGRESHADCPFVKKHPDRARPLSGMAIGLLHQIEVERQWENQWIQVQEDQLVDQLVVAQKMGFRKP